MMAHESPMWPAYGHYECRTCGRQFPVCADEALANQVMRAPLNSALLLGLVWDSEGGKR